MNVDLVNSGFEAVAAVLAWRSVFVLRRDREVRGLYWPAVAWSGVWSLWNGPYYLAVGHHYSFVVTLVREAATLTWLALLWRFRK